MNKELSFKEDFFNKHASYALKNDLTFELTFEQFTRLIISDCYYCGNSPDLYNGIDRISFNEGYIEGNCVTCCRKCSLMKSGFDREGFRVHLKKAYQHQFDLGGNVKKYRVLVGRWQPPHKSHQWLAQEASNNWEEPLLIFVRDIPPDEKNPFTTEQTMDMLRKVFAGKDVVVSALPDVAGVHYGRGVGYDITEHQPPEDIKRVSATAIREGIKSGDDSWKEMVDPKIHDLVVEYLTEG